MPNFILTPTILAGSLMFQSMLRPSSAVSMEASALRERAALIEQNYELSIALYDYKARLLQSLYEFAKECSDDNWDDYDASAVSEATVANAEKFIRALPDSLEMPELSVDPDGSISFDWIPDSTRTFTLSVSGSNRLAYAWIDGLDRGHATARFENGAIPDRVLTEIKTIANNASTLRVA